VHRQFVGNVTSSISFIANILDHGLQRWQQFKLQQIQRQQLSQSNRNLREMQDREYQRALQQQREQENIENMNNVNNEDVEQQQQQQLQHDDTANDVHIVQQQNRIKIAKEKIEKLSALIEKAPKDKLIKVALRLPNGKRVQHIFCSENTVQSLFDFARCHELKVDDQYIEQFELVCSFPKRIFTPNDKEFNKKLSEVGIEHSTILFVQQKD